MKNKGQHMNRVTANRAAVSWFTVQQSSGGLLVFTLLAQEQTGASWLAC